MPTKNDALMRESGLRTLGRYAHARDRKIDRELRTITISDDEAAAILEYISILESQVG